jgi:hypothetical protein
MLKIILIVSTLSLVFCNVPSKNNSVHVNERLRAIVVSEVLPFPDSTGRFTLYDTLYIPIYYYKDLTAYKLFYLVGEQNANGVVGTKKGNYQYFVFENNTRYGYIYDSSYPQKHDKVSVDSMMKNAIWCEQNNFYPAFAENSIHLISSKQNKDSGSLQEVYSYKGIKDSTRNGVFSMEFTNKL